MKKTGRRILSLVLAATMALSPSVNTLASDWEEPSYVEDDTALLDMAVEEDAEEVLDVPEDNGQSLDPAPEETPEDFASEDTAGDEEYDYASEDSAEDEEYDYASEDGAWDEQDDYAPEEDPHEDDFSEEEGDDVQTLEMPAFEEIFIVNEDKGIRITVKAPEGAFPEDAVLSVEEIPEKDIPDEAVKAVEEARSDEQEITASYTFDIKVLGANEEELQPAGGQPVEISFALPEVNDPDLTAFIYHITENETTGELTAEKLDAEVVETEGTVKAETTGFSLYQVEFTDKDEEETSQDGASAEVKVQGESLTKNIVGDVFVNTLNASEEAKEASLINYPLEHHDDVSEYGDSPRVRYIEGGDAEGSNYLVYRDSYLLISEEDSANYTVTFSEDGLTAYITPALSVEEVQGKDGVVFLAKDVTLDNILVFDEEPAVDGDTMTVSLRRTEDILANEVFSDGELAPEQEAVLEKPMLRASIPDIEWETKPKGTNWKGEIKSFRPSWPTPRYKLDVWDLLFELGMNLTFDMDFHITTTGSSNGTEKKEIASIEIPIKTVFALKMDYTLVVEFDDTPIDVEGTLTTNFNVDVGTHGASVNNYRNKVKIKKLQVDPENAQPRDEYCNKDVKFYIGSELACKAKVLYIKINLKIKTIKLGPVLELVIAAGGGCDIKARHEKDQYTAPPDRNGDMIHTCTANGDNGCVDIQVIEKNRSQVTGTLDLYFRRFSFTPYDSGVRILGASNFYKSETYDGRTGDVKEGICPHRLYKVPVAVWKGYDGSEYIDPAAGMDVSVNDDLTKLITSEEIEEYATGKTDETGRTDLFLPWYNARRYTVVANGKINTGADGATTVSGSKQMDSGMKMESNDPVNIVVNADEKISLTVNMDWIVDEQKLDIPDITYLRIQIQRRAGEAGEWKDVILTGVDEIGNWTVTYENPLDKYTVVNGKAVLYEYRVRALWRDPGTSPSDRVIIAEGGTNTYEHKSYTDYVGDVEPEGTTKYLFHYAEPVTNGNEYSFTITGTAVMDITLNKQWLRSDPDDEIPESVYLALLQKPYFGWEDKAAEKGVPTEWVAALDPVEGQANTFRSLEDAEVIYIIEDISTIENRPLAIGEVSAENNWSVKYTVPKYRNGVKLMWQGAELDSTVIRGVLSNEYDLNIPVSVSSFGDYITVPGAANAEYNNYERTATVFNSTYDSHTIAGTVRWQAYRGRYDTLPDDLEVRICVLKDGGEIEESKSNPIILKAADHPGEATWIWTLTGDGIDSSEDYTVVEEFLAPEGQEGYWFCDINGLDVYNYRMNPESPKFILMNATFEDGVDQDNLQCVNDEDLLYEGRWLRAPLYYKGTEVMVNDRSVYLRHDPGLKNDWFYFVHRASNESGIISDYKFTAPEIKGLTAVYGKPYAKMWGSQLAYCFSVHYIPETKLTLQVAKQWENMDATAKTSGAYPEKVAYKVYRDSELIAEGTLEAESEWNPVVPEESEDEDDSEGGEDEDPAPPAEPDAPKWTSVTIDKVEVGDHSGDPLYRYWQDEDNEYHKYIYTVVETPVEGFASAVTRTDNVTDSENEAAFTLTNTWVGPDYVHAKGEVFWKGDEGKEYLRPDTVKISVVNSKEEYIRTIEVPIKAEESDDDDEEEIRFTWEAKYLPGKDEDGNELKYAVLESHVKGYTTTYDKPELELDEETGKWYWTCDVTNELTGYFPLTIKKVIEGEPGTEEEYTFTVENKDSEDGTDREIPLPVNKEDLKIKSSDETREVIAEFLLDEDGLYLYSVKENKGSADNCKYDDSEKLVLISRFTEKNPETGKTEVKFDSWVADAGDNPTDEDATVDGNPVDGEPDEDTPGEDDDDSDPASGVQTDDNESDTVEFVNVYANMTITKKWDIDLLGKDKPDSIEVVVQKKNGDKWENVRLVELNNDNDWKAEVYATGDTLRVRELKEEEKGLFDQLKDKLKGMVTGYLDDEYSSVISTIKDSEYYSYLPDSIQNAANEGADKLKEQLNATSGDLFDKLVEQLGLAALGKSDEDRVVYDKGDGDKPKDADANEVTYKVGDGETKYRVEYDEDDDDCTITNTAIRDVDLIKRWLAFDVDENGVRVALEDKVEDKPDSAWVVLMFTLKPEDLAGDYSEQLSSLMEQTGFDVSVLSDYELPVFKLTDGVPFYLEDGMGPASVISQLTLGIDLGVLDKLIPCEMAIAKVDEDSNWRQHFVVGKYAFGIPVEFKGAELGSEVIRQIVKYLSAGLIKSPISYNPFNDYFSIPMKAYPKYAGITDPTDLMDISGLGSKVIGAVKNLLLKPETWKNISFENMASGVADELKDENDQMANVINIKIDWDVNLTPVLTKNWEGDEEENRPDTLKIILKDELAEGDEEIEVILKKEDFEGLDTWTYDLSELDEKEEDGSSTGDSGDEDDDEEEATPHSYVVVREEYPENYDHQKDYDCEIDGLELTNTWKDPEKVIIRGKKIWEDDDDQDGIRPETVKIKLLSSVNGEEPKPVMVTVKEKDEDGNEIEKEVELTVETSKQGDWKYYFPEQPRYKDAADDADSDSGEDGDNDQNGGDNDQNSGNDNEKRQEITYSVEEVKTDVITGEDGEGTYAVSYETKHDSDENDNWIIDITNTHTTRKITVEKKWVDRDGKESDEWKPESVKVVLQHKKGAGSTDTETEDVTDAGNDGSTGETANTDTETWETVGEPVELNDANNWKAELHAKGLTESTVADWRIRELDPDGKVIFAKDDEDRPKDAKNEIVLNVKKDDKNNDVPYVVSYEFTEEPGEESGEKDGLSDKESGEESGANTHTIITNKLNGKQITVEKSWDIDLEKKDHPDSIEAVIQEKKDDKWETVALLELNGDNSWKASRFLPVEREGKEIEYRARELRQETALEEIVKKLKETISSAATGSYNEIIGQIKTSAGSYYEALPDVVKNAADQGSDKLKEELKTTTENLYDKLLEKIGIAASEDRIVYDKDDSDKKTDDGKKDGDGEDGKEDETKKKETNVVTYYVKEYDSVVSGDKESAHNTKYRVKYEKDGDTLKITNKAILEIDVIKRWIGLGVDDEDMPDSAWVVLMFKVKEGAKDKAKGLPGVDSLPLDKLLDYDFPVFNWDILGDDVPFLLEKGQDPLSIISQLTLGINLDIFSGVLPKMAIARVTKDDNWRVHYVVSKYAMGLPVEFKGAELGSEVIRQIIKYVTGSDIFISYNPFDNFFSIPTPAIRTIEGIEDPEDFLDMSKLTGKFLDKAKSLTMDELKDFGPETLLTDSQLMANVINVKIDWDTSQDQILIKNWAGDKEEDRPEYIEVYLKDGDQELEEPVRLEKKDFEGEDTWTYDLSELDKKEEDTGDDEGEDKDKPEHSYSVVREAFPDDYEHADDYEGKIDELTITNTWKDPEKVNISGRKIWEDDDDKDGIRPEKITVKLLADGEEIQSVETSKEGGWKYHFTDLPKYKEASEDEDAEDGGSDSEDGKTEIVYTIEEDEVEGYELEEGSGTEENGYNLTNKHEPDTISIEGEKVWEDNDDQDGVRPDSITIRLKADGKEVDTLEVEEENGSWFFKFEDLPKTSGGSDITYTITEDTVEDYTTKIEGGAEEGFTVTNTYEPGKTQVNVTKVWDDKDDQDGIRPDSVTVKLLSDGEAVTDEDGSEVTLELSEENSWTGTFENLDVSKDGKEITYSVEEETDEDVITGEDGEGTYSVKVSGDAAKGFTVTNKHTPGTIKVEGEKTWEDEDDQDGKRPGSIVIRLKAGGEEVKRLTITESSGWKWSFDGLPRYKDGEEIGYSISEDNVPDYTTEIDEFDVTNTYTPGKTQIDVTKVWKDEDDRDGIRPNSVTIRLLADGEPAGDEEGSQLTLVLSEGNSWTGSFKDLDQKKDGKDIVYTVEEEETDVITGEDAEGTYAYKVTGDAKKGFTVTNTHTPETITIEGTKEWDDADNKDGIRPASITIRLKADGEEVDSVEVKADENGDWTWRFEDLPVKKEGKEISYTITEDALEDYTTSINGDAESGFTVTNTYTPGKTQVNVSKVWNDKDDQDAVRPASVTINLLADGEPAKDEKGVPLTLILSEGNGWSGSFKDLDQKKDGKEIEYTVEEEETDVITGKDAKGTYAYEVTGDAVKGFTVTNTHTPETISIEGTKVWDDKDDQDGKRPESILIRLKADGKDVVVKTVTAADDWKWSYANLPKYDGEREITYTLTEDTVSGYTTKVDGDAKSGFTVTNTYDPGKTQVNVTKAWNDDNDRDGIRPTSVTIRLISDGEPVTDADGSEVTLELSEENSWTGTFKDLPAMKDGKTIRYAVEETLTNIITGTDAEGTYAVNVAGTAAKGFTVTNTHTPQKIRIEVTKIWDDKNDQDGKRPKSVTISLLADGKPVKDEKGAPLTLVLSADNGWKGVFDGLDKKKDGEYTVEEEKTAVITGVDGPGTYAIDVNKSGATDNGFTVTVTNTHTPELITITGKKKWDDNDDQDGIRPDRITIRLKADGEEVDKQTVAADRDRDWSFVDLPKYEGGKEIVYDITEDPVKDYITKKEGDVKNGFTVTNTHAPGKTQVKVSKVWDDRDNLDKSRPESITIRLWKGTGKDLEEVDKKTVATDRNREWSFDDLPKYEGGKEIVYSITEDTVKDYTSKIKGDAVNGFTITNTHTPLLEITYDLNGGTYKGSAAKIIETYPYGTVIKIHEAPVQTGYKFLYWKGSEYDPGDSYTVTENHTFVAQWEKNTTPTPTPSVTPTPTPTPGNTDPRTPTGVKTGDTSNTGMWLAVLILAMAVIAADLAARRKRRQVRK